MSTIVASGQAWTITPGLQESLDLRRGNAGGAQYFDGRCAARFPARVSVESSSSRWSGAGSTRWRGAG